MIQVAYPPPDFRLKTKEDKQFIFDNIRRRWLLLTPEEWVRQNFVQYLIQVLGYPKEVVALEKEFMVNGLPKRFDILIYDSLHKPWMMVECKAPEIKLSENVQQQILRYQISVPAQWMVITNGNTTLAWQNTGGNLEKTNQLPTW